MWLKCIWNYVLLRYNWDVTETKKTCIFDMSNMLHHYRPIISNGLCFGCCRLCCVRMPQQYVRVFWSEKSSMSGYQHLWLTVFYKLPSENLHICILDNSLMWHNLLCIEFRPSWTKYCLTHCMYVCMYVFICFHYKL